MSKEEKALLIISIVAGILVGVFIVLVAMGIIQIG